MDEEKKTLYEVIIVLTLLVLVFGGYFVYNEFISNKDVEDKVKEETKTNTTNITKEDDYGTVTYDFDNMCNGENCDEDFEKKLSLLKINDNDILSFIEETDYVYNVHCEKYKEFVIILLDRSTDCGIDIHDLYIFSYGGKILFKSSSHKSDIDTLIFSGDYNYNKFNNELTLEYRISCDFNCNVCQIKDLDENEDTCVKYNKIKNDVVSSTYVARYKNGKFSNEELNDSITFEKDIKYMNDVFERCKKQD